MRRIVFAVLILACVVSARTSAQMPEPEKWDNVEWYVVFGWQFSGAMADSAATIFWDRINPVMAEAWPGTVCLRVMTGKMGVSCFGPMEDGLEGMTWKTSPNDINFFSMFLEREGEAGMELFDVLGDATTGVTFNIALKHTGGM